MHVGQSATRSRVVTLRDIELFTEMTEVLEAREDKPIYTLRTTITNQDGVVVLDGTALVYRDPIVATLRR
jgi:hypothetical protein